MIDWILAGLWAVRDTLSLLAGAVFIWWTASRNARNRQTAKTLERLRFSVENEREIRALPPDDLRRRAARWVRDP